MTYMRVSDLAGKHDVCMKVCQILRANITCAMRVCHLAGKHNVCMRVCQIWQENMMGA